MSTKPRKARSAPTTRAGKSKPDRNVALTPAEHLGLEQVVQACRRAGIAAGKDELLRAAVELLAMQEPAALERHWRTLAPVKRKKASQG